MTAARIPPSVYDIYSQSYMLCFHLYKLFILSISAAIRAPASARASKPACGVPYNTTYLSMTHIAYNLFNLHISASPNSFPRFSDDFDTCFHGILFLF